MPHRINPSEAARAMQALRKNKRGGRPKMLKECDKCGLALGARERRGHKCEVSPTIPASAPPAGDAAR